ncbi:O-fucosyltransferase 37 [Tripterygium wilfordii]|uniref:O-fucosyltransferase 37 n=1 Tax=Tripterygium wilfordii TaxID=458696 RepID=UPI0018F82ED0|nr:O-fucosyltransferase 37 [Tripterygium wilfordii]
MARSRNIKNPFSTLTPSSPTFSFYSDSPLVSLIFSPKKSPRLHSSPRLHTITLSSLSLFFLSLLVSFTFLGIFVLTLIPNSQDSVPCSLIPPSSPLSVSYSQSHFVQASLSSIFSNKEAEAGLAQSIMLPLPAREVSRNVSEEEREFWQQPNGEEYRPCLGFSLDYRRESARISKEKRRFLVVVASGGLNQQRNQIVDAVVIARILEAALVVPVLQVNLIWGDESEFGEIFDVEQFKRTLQADVRVVSSLPSTHLMSRQSIENQIPYDVSPLWIRTKFFRQLSEEGLLVLKGLDSKLSKNLPHDLQKLRCKVAFHALRFASPIRELGYRLARRMWIEGPYIALHLRLEKDVWVRTGCLTGLGPEYDKIITKTRESQPQYLTGRLNMTHAQRRLAGLCPLNALEMARFLKALGAPRSARVYIAGGEPFGGSKAMQPLVADFPNLVTKEMLAREGELSPFTKKASVLAAIDYIVSLSSDVFIPSHGGNMGRALQGHRAYVGHRKYIKPNKRFMIPFFEDSSLSDAEFGRIVRKLHRKTQGQPFPTNNKRDQDVTANPVPECMCKHKTAKSRLAEIENHLNGPNLHSSESSDLSFQPTQCRRRRSAIASPARSKRYSRHR